MNLITNIENLKTRTRYFRLFLIFCAGLVFPLGFAPFALPGMAFISIAFFYHELTNIPLKKAFFRGWFYGIGLFGSGVSWVIVSIHNYGQMNMFLSLLITLLFIFYLSLFPAIMASGFIWLKGWVRLPPSVLFSALWILTEYIRSTLFTGFPWLRMGNALIDTPMKYLAPIVGIYGLGLLGCLAATLLVSCVIEKGQKKRICMIGFALMIVFPWIFKNVQWAQVDKKPISTAIIQANLSMRDKWDETLFEYILKFYSETLDKLSGTKLIVMPETAIPVSDSYVRDYLDEIGRKALESGSAILTGILQAEDNESELMANTLLALGNAKGQYAKQHLVPFGEYIPKPFKAVNAWMDLPEPNIRPGLHPSNISVDGYPIASLICYEIAYQEILRQQLPGSQWIVSISDNGWFGHSLASSQQFQMARMLSLLTGRYQVVSNNDGLSSIINDQGDVTAGLSAFSTGILRSEVYPASGMTPWVRMGDKPVLILCLLILIAGYLRMIIIKK